ncbi:AAA family ATPase [Leucobacter iarius]|uniref:Rad50/SbcC-type AAA domain-containing protein n=1 Tax=Leucobacter iarius TaxID=333963 RepID=A0ABN2LJN1_9MICO
MRDISLEVESFKRIRAGRIEPDKSGSTVISAKNGQGKSSALSAIRVVFGGHDGNKAAKSIRDGAESARVRLDPGKVMVTRTWCNRTAAVRAESKEGSEHRSPQVMLDRIAFDSVALTRLRGREQKRALLTLVDLDAVAHASLRSAPTSAG